MTNNKLKIAAYIRSACENKEAIIRQETIIMMYCKKYFSNYTIDFYTDTNCSGNTINGRNAYPILRDKLCNNEYDILIVENISRLFRAMNEETVCELNKIINTKARIIFIGMGYDNIAPEELLKLYAIDINKLYKKVPRLLKRGEIDAKKINRRST